MNVDDQHDQPWEPFAGTAPASVDLFVAALLEAGPEAAEHLLKAAQELLLAAKAVVDAGERAVEAHRARDDAGTTDAPDPRDERHRGVRRIDLA